MTNPTTHGQVPEALRLAQELDAVPETGADPQTIQDAAAELRRLHFENETLRMGYAAARLALVQYGAHDGACSVGDLDGEGRHCACDCGYESAIKAAEDKAHNAKVSGLPTRPPG